jgi:hypothetical protein
MALEGEFQFPVDEFPSNGELAALWAVTWPFPVTQDFRQSLRACLLHVTARMRFFSIQPCIRISTSAGL